MATLTTIRAIASIAAAQDLELHQMDFDTAFLNADLEEEVYVEQPPGYRSRNLSDHVCRLNKAMYGVRQAQKAWHRRAHEFITEILRLTQSTHDPCLYTKRSQDGVTLMTIYVDHLLIAASSIQRIKDIKESFCQFTIKDLGESSLILGIEISRDRAKGTITLRQAAYAKAVLQRYNCADARAVKTPMEDGLNLSVRTDDATRVEAPYAQAIGSLMYLAVATRPDLVFAGGGLARYTSKYQGQHWTAVKRVFRFIQGTRDFGLTDRRGNQGPTANAVGYSDSDFPGDLESKKYTTGFVFLLNNGAVAWSSKLQTLVTLSSTEAEYVALCAAAQEATSLRGLLQEIYDLELPPIEIHEDNQSTIKLAETSSYHKRSKHIDVKFHFTRQAVEAGTVTLAYSPTSDMIADALTKPLCKIKHHKFVQGLGLTATDA